MENEILLEIARDVESIKITAYFIFGALVSLFGFIVGASKPRQERP